jgi:hypothetical protein
MRKGINISVWLSAVAEIARRVAWFPLAVFLMHELSAHVFDFYKRWPPIDIPLHLVGGFATAFFCSGAIDILHRHGLISAGDRLVRRVLIFALVCTAAVFWEFVEWTTDHTIGTFCQVGLDDTMLDMFCGIMGGSAFILLSFLRGSGGKSACNTPENLDAGAPNSQY